jgi:hypothetical protein
MLVHERLWENLETPDKIQELTESVSKIHKFALLSTNQYKQQMELVIGIIEDIVKKLSTENAIASGVEEVSGSEKVVYKPLPYTHAGAQNVTWGYKNIKQLEKRKGRFWLFKSAPDTIS